MNPEQPTASGPSDKAIEAATARLEQTAFQPHLKAAEVLGVAYPIIRADVIAEVVAAVREGSAGSWHGDYWAHKIEEWFG